MSVLRVVHLSDIHLKSSTDFETGNYLHDLVQDLGRRLEKLDEDGPASRPIVVISGDLTYHGLPNEFDDFEKFLSLLRERTNPMIVSLAPGNHDLNWAEGHLETSTLMEDILQNPASGLARAEQRFTRKIDTDLLRSGMSNYYSMLEHLSIPYTDYLYSIQTIVFDGFKVNIVALNSAYLFFPKDKLWGYIGQHQIERALAEADSLTNFPNGTAVINIVTFHHPFTAIAPASSELTKQIISLHSDLILAGHIHQSGISIDLTSQPERSATTRGQPVISISRCVWDESNDPSVVPGYSIIDLFIEEKRLRKANLYETRYLKNASRWWPDLNEFKPRTLPLPVTSSEPINIARVHVADSTVLGSWGWDVARMVRDTMRLDYESLQNLEVKDEGESPQWAEIVTTHPNSWRVLYEYPGSIIGYWHFVPLFPEEFEVAKAGKLLDGAITIDKIPEFEIPGRYRLYFMSMVLQSQYRGTGAVRLIYQSFLDVMEKLAETGVFFDEICANAWSPAGEAICRTFQMNHLADHISKGRIFYRKFFPLPSLGIVKTHPRLAQLYAQEFDTG